MPSRRRALLRLPSHCRVPSRLRTVATEKHLQAVDRVSPFAFPGKCEKSTIGKTYMLSKIPSHIDGVAAKHDHATVVLLGVFDNLLSAPALAVPLIALVIAARRSCGVRRVRARVGPRFLLDHKVSRRMDLLSPRSAKARCQSEIVEHNDRPLRRVPIEWGRSRPEILRKTVLHDVKIGGHREDGGTRGEDVAFELPGCEGGK